MSPQMDKLDSELITRIEAALDIKFWEWQKKYILDIPMMLDMKITGRRTGKTLAYIIKLLFSDDTPIKAYNLMDVVRYVDRYSFDDKDGYYTKWFRNYLVDIYNTLTSVGISPRLVLINKNEYERLVRDVR